MKGRPGGLVRSLAGAAAMMAGCAICAAPAYAVPGLQLDIVGGTYDAATQSVVIDSNQFTVLALATPTGNISATEILGEDFFLSIALLPPPGQSPGFNSGSFAVNGTTIASNDASLLFGTPPADAPENGNLPGHSVFPTYYTEHLFHFDAADRTTTYNSQDNPGGTLFDDSGSGTYFVAFEIDMAGLLGYELHFDLYDIRVKRGEIIIDHFAPFSHDAESIGGNNEVPEEDIPEPASALLFLAALVGCGWTRLRAIRRT